MHWGSEKGEYGSDVGNGQRDRGFAQKGMRVLWVRPRYSRSHSVIDLDMSNAIKRINAACIDGRAQSPRYIQQQLLRLHDTLVEAAKHVRDAIQSDSHHTASEVEVEYYLALQSIKDQYLQLNFERIIEDEYRLANLMDSPSRTVAAGVIYISPADHTRLYSIIAPVAAAIAAGNCVILELKQTLLKLTALLRKLLTQTLDSDTFAVVETRPDDQDPLWQYCIQVHEALSDDTPSFSRLISPSQSRVVCVIDRSADLEQAARATVRARFSFKGRSPYAPDVVLVNEFRQKQFCNAVVQEVTKHFAEQIDSNSNGSISKKERQEGGPLLKEVRDEDTATVLVSGATGSVVHLKERTSPLLRRKIGEAMLFVHAISSLDDAIDFANSGSESLLAAYLFAVPAAAKYLSQFINAHVTCTNDIPADLLVGPAAPLGFPVSIHARYSKAMFSVPRPEFINFSARSAAIAKTLDGVELDGERKLREEAQKPLPPTGQRPGKAIGFFEQGLLIGATILAVSALTTLAAAGVLVVPNVIRRVR